MVIAGLATFALTPMWFRLPNAAPPFSVQYAVGFAVFIPAVLTVLLWLYAGLPGLTTLRNDRHRLIFAIALGLLVIWVAVSVNWAFMRETHPQIAEGMAFQWLVAGAFALAILCAPPPPRLLCITLAITMSIHALIGGAQVAVQGSTGLAILGEFDLNPLRSGVSVIEADGIRWLRPYGLASHPNIYAGFIAVGLLAAASLSLSRQHILRLLSGGALLVGWWLLLLSFSRGAWVGITVGGLLLAGLSLYYLPDMRRTAAALLALLLAMGLIFLVLYSPLVFTRAGLGADRETLEIQSVEDRALFYQIGFEAVRRYPLQGVGAGNFPWYASFYLASEMNARIRGNNIHNVYLSAQAELGLPGTISLLVMLIAGIRSGITRADWKHDHYRWALLAGGVSLAIIGLFDHYPWTMLHFQILWWGLLAACAHYTSPTR